MRLAEERALSKALKEVENEITDKPKHLPSTRGTIWDMLVPLIALNRIPPF